MSLKSRPGRCWACGEAHLAVDDPVEHIVGSALGSTLTTDRFGGSCNRELGVRVDQPFCRDFLVAVSRARHGVRDPRRSKRPPPNPRHRAKTPDGRPVVFDWRDGSMTLPPHVAEDGERVVITAETEAEARQAAKAKIKRMRRKGQEVKLTPAKMRREKSDEPITAEMSLSFNTTLRARAAAKIALGAFSLVLPEDWLNTDAAKLLQSWLWDDKPKTSEGEVIFAPPKRVPPPIDSFGRPPLHTLFFLPSGNSAMFGIVLFGEELMMTATGPLDRPAPEVAWQIDPIARTYEETSFWDLVIQARDTYPTEYETFASELNRR